eukprot:358180-Chlamydomonas_euryale.AAC.7
MSCGLSRFLNQALPGVAAHLPAPGARAALASVDQQRCKRNNAAAVDWRCAKDMAQTTTCLLKQIQQECHQQMQRGCRHGEAVEAKGAP